MTDTNHSVALAFEDGVTRFITVASGQTVADASYSARINIPLDCRDGACGTCKAFCESGKYDGGDYIEDALTDDEAEAGYCLPCQMTPESDLVLRISGTAEMAKSGIGTFQATIVKLHWYADNTAGLTLAVEDRERLAYLPGQYMNVQVPGTDQERSYSFSSGPDAEQLTFLVRTAPDGAMTTYLKERAAEGDTLTLEGPKGSFFLRDVKRPVLMLAGGTGIAPQLAMLEKLSAGAAAGTVPAFPIHLAYGATWDKDLVEVEALERYAATIPGFTFSTIVADADSQHPRKGYVTGHLLPEHLNDGDVDVYLCGPPAMVDAVRRYFDAEGIEPTNFYYERFAVGAAAPALAGAGAA
ncbi:benzoate 1,2-dioxygenase electron transfer component BenC [Sinomonas atrocyanea]|uniref:benzoate 1,2-dioxygenase electron transfer component BenC n=1 Tax=Sinomonas atrocyanea TaxID=37927 RepID=UPI00278266E7|nr:benzoate 1,2-dioxygenase electron transfer component BenC [Sinomonas atrocyanea]MDQ0260801.1 benzoate/toluate 1,2-dioxygenase reductase subunit [Sinomonas atrocyanea]MDR6622216.1 benzoate/toluate 1,2-dioxygenase reductase subunit [Sinomonas atrocyanea]